MKLINSFRKLCQIITEPNARSEDDLRHAYIFNVLIAGTIVLSALALISELISRFTTDTNYETVPVWAMLLIVGFFTALFIASKRGYYQPAAVIYLLFFFCITTYPIYRWGILLPQGVLTYCLIIVVAGVLPETRGALLMALATTSALLFIEYLSSTGQIQFNTQWMRTTGGYNDVIVYGFTFAIVVLVCRLSSKQIKQSLQRARRSEHALRLERNRLEVRVRERTSELERAQIEKLEELNRFAEFGRISSTLLHELANPLTAAVLNLELMKGKHSTALYEQLHESISFMDQYVQSARRQLRRESEVGDFNVAAEVRRVIGFMRPKAEAMNVTLQTSLDKQAILNGDSVKFNQIIANLLANAIDAYESLLAAPNQPIIIKVVAKPRSVEVSIADHGIGLTSSELKHIFDPFYTTKQTHRGTGLGLTITKRTVEEDFGGTIAVTSSKSRGTCFTVRIPVNEH